MRINEDFLLYFSLSKWELVWIDNNWTETVFLWKDIIDKYKFFKVLNFKHINWFLSNIFSKNSNIDWSNNLNYSFLSKINSNKVALWWYTKYNIYDILEKKFIFNNFDKYKIFMKRTNEYWRDYSINRLISLKLKKEYTSSNDFWTYPLYIDEDIWENEPYLKKLLIYAHPEENKEIYFIRQYYRDLENWQYENVYKKTTWENWKKPFKEFVWWYKWLEKIKILSIKPLNNHKYKVELNLFYKWKSKAEYISITKIIKEKYGKTFLETKR